MTTLILGGPGCGKTTALLKRVDKALEQGTEPHQIAFVSFTRKAAEEARSRALTRFGLNKDDLPHFKTLHSMAFAFGGFTPQEMLSRNDIEEFGRWMNITIKAEGEEDGVILTNQDELNAYSFARLKCTSLQNECYEKSLNYTKADHLNRHYEKFKKHHRKYDFTDLIEKFVERGEGPRLSLLIVDEAQDLSALQWKMVDILAANADEVVIAGDDDQAIYEWAGADVEHFLAIKADETEVLPRSYRLPSSIHSVVRKIAGMIGNRFEKNFTYDREGGNVTRVSKLQRLDMSEGSWLVLARNNYQLSEPKTILRETGLPYIHQGKSSVDTPSCHALLAWESLRKGNEINGEQANLVINKLPSRLLDTRMKFRGDDVVKMNDLVELGLKETPDWMHALIMPKSESDYFRNIKRRGESLINKPRITVSTIHAVKGGEADSVALYTDMSASSYRSLIRSQSSESRVFYVGASRAKKNLHIIDPKTAKSFRVPT